MKFSRKYVVLPQPFQCDEVTSTLQSAVRIDFNHRFTENKNSFSIDFNYEQYKYITINLQ